MHTGGSPPSPDTPAQKCGEGGGRGEAPEAGHVSVPQAKEQQLLTRVWSSDSTGAGDPRGGREGKESGAKVGDPCLRELLSPTTPTTPRGPRDKNGTLRACVSVCTCVCMVGGAFDNFSVTPSPNPRGGWRLPQPTARHSGRSLPPLSLPPCVPSLALPSLPRTEFIFSVSATKPEITCAAGGGS